LPHETKPGITRFEMLAKIKEFNSTIPVVLITKNETENLMDDAIGSQISDYLIKPVNPNQVLLSLKKIIDNKRLVAEKTTSAYQQQFRHLFMALNSNPDYNEWMEIYKKLVYWELEMEKSDSPEMQEVFQSQKNEANTEFYKFISKQYSSWAEFLETGRFAVAGGAPGVSAILGINQEKKRSLIVLSNYDEGSAEAVFQRVSAILNKQTPEPLQPSPAIFLYDLMRSKGAVYFSANVSRELQEQH